MISKKNTLPRPQAPDVVDSEKTMAGSILLEPERVLKLARAAGVTADTFSDGVSRRVFAAAVRLIDAGRLAEPVEVQRESALDAATVQALIDNTPTAAHAEYHIGIVRAAAAKRAALRQIKDADGVEALRLALRQIEATLPAAMGAGAVLSLADLADPVPEAENEAALFRNGWLRKGGGAFLVSTSGTGKSVATIQAALMWSMGKAAFGIDPVRPLKIAVIQAEDDSEEMADFRNQITGGLVESGLDRSEVQTACASITLADATGKTGEGFITFVGELLRTRPEIDLLVINPFQSFFGGDVSHNAELSQFLRTWLDPLIKPGRVGVLFVHHTNKPPTAKDRKGWGADTFSAYIGAGGAELVNWARAVLALMPCEEVPGLFRLVAGKRGGRLGWKDGDGNKTTTRFIAHSEGRIFWRDASPEEMTQATSGDTSRTRRSFSREQIASCFTATEQTYADALRSIQQSLGVGTNRAKEIVSQAVSDGIASIRTEGRKTLYRLKADMV